MIFARISQFICPNISTREMHCLRMIQQSTSFTILLVFVVNLLAISGNVPMTWSSPMYPKLYSNDTSVNPLGKPITTDEDEWIGSLVNIGAMCGSFPFGLIADKFGRKIGLLCIAIPHMVSYITMAFATNVYLFYFGRLFGGLAVGGGYTLLPMYVAEIAESSKRGMYSVTLGVFWAVGDFLPYAIGPFLSIKWFNIIVACLPSIFFIVFVAIGIETPYYLLGANRPDEAKAVLRLLRNTKDIDPELLTIKHFLDKEETGKFFDIFKSAYLMKALLISLILIMFQQMSGINAISYYLESIFDSSGSKLPSKAYSVVTGVVIVVLSIPLPFIVDRFGRKTLLIFSSLGISVGLILMGGFFYLLENSYNTDSIFWLPLFNLIFIILSSSMGLAVLPWTVSSELFPKNMKNISASAVSITCWLTAFLVTKYFQEMTKCLGTAGTFWCFAASCILCALFTLLFVPETRGKSFQEIQDMLRHKNRNSILIC